VQFCQAREQYQAVTRENLQHAIRDGDAMKDNSPAPRPARPNTLLATFPGADLTFSIPCGAISRRPYVRATGFAHSDGAARASRDRPTPSAERPKIPPSRTQIRPSRSKKMGLEFLGFLRPIRGFSMGYEQPKAKIQLAGVSSARRPAPLPRLSLGRGNPFCSEADMCRHPTFLLR